MFATADQKDVLVSYQHKFRGLVSAFKSKKIRKESQVQRAVKRLSPYPLRDAVVHCTTCSVGAPLSRLPEESLIGEVIAFLADATRSPISCFKLRIAPANAWRDASGFRKRFPNSKAVGVCFGWQPRQS